MAVGRQLAGDRADQEHRPAGRQQPSGDAGGQGEYRHDREQTDNRPDQRADRPLGPRPDAGDHGQRDTEQQPDPPRCDDAPPDAKQRRVVGAEHRRVADGEVLDAHAGRHLVVGDAVAHGRDHAHHHDAERLHVGKPSAAER